MDVWWVILVVLQNVINFETEFELELNYFEMLLHLNSI